MNCETALLAMNAAVDGELSDADRLVLERHLLDCPSCREEWLDLQNLDGSLRQALRPRSLDMAIDRVMTLINEPANPPQHSWPSTELQEPPGMAKPIARRVHERFDSRPASGRMVWVLVVLLLVVSFALREPSKSIAEVTYTTGSVEIRPEGSRAWVMLTGSKRVSLRSKTRVRTGENALCEIRTTSDALVRLNQGTELLLQEPERLELVSGELWCRAPADMPMKISPEPIADHSPPPKNVWSCSSSSETQWESKPDHEFRCLAVSPKQVEISVDDSAVKCSMNPGEIRSFESKTNAKLEEHADLLRATAWQLPLLILRDRDDRELQQRLAQLLAQIGQTKMSYLYEDQIRQLGPAGTLPLLAYVQSAESKTQPELRQRAMRIIADLAPRSATTELEQLLSDSDPVIRQLSSHALQRLSIEK